MNLSYSMKLYNNEQMKINYRFKKTKSKEILYKKESVVIPLISDSVYCDYKFIIPDGYISLGLQENLLTKQSNTLYTYKGNCPTFIIWLLGSPKFTSTVSIFLSL